MKKLGLLGIICLFSMSLWAQSPSALQEQENLETLAVENLNNTTNVYDNTYKGVKGSPFLFKEWSIGKVVLADKKQYKAAAIKYDVFQGQVVVKNEAGIPIIVETKNIASFSLTEKATGVTYNFQNQIFSLEKSDKEITGFFEAVHDGKVKLLLKRGKRFVKADASKTYSTGRDYDEFLPLDALYISDKDGKAYKAKYNKATLLKACADKQAEIKTFIKRNKLDVLKQSDFLKVLQHYETL